MSDTKPDSRRMSILIPVVVSAVLICIIGVVAGFAIAYFRRSTLAELATPIPTAQPTVQAPLPTPAPTLTPSALPTQTQTPTDHPTATSIPTTTIPTTDPLQPVDTSKLTGHIAFVMRYTTQPGAFSTDAFLMAADGSSIIRVTGTGLTAGDISLSPDGRQIVFSDEAPNNSHIFIANADGSNVRKLIQIEDIYRHGTTDHLPTWSPDGTQIAFVRARQWKIHIVSASGEPIKELSLAEKGLPNALSWSPDGRKLVYHGDGFGYYIIDVETNEISVLLDIHPNGTGPLQRGVAWSPDGQKIALTLKDPERSPLPSLALINPDGSGLQHVMDGAWFPAWSPDGQHIAFCATEDEVITPESLIYLYVMRLDGSGVTKLLTSGFCKASPSWGQ